MADPRAASAKGPSTLGYFFFSFYISMWVLAQFFALVAVYLAVCHRRFSCLVLWLAYLVYRKLNRATRWPGIQKATARFMQKYPPFRSQKLVLDIDEMPKPNSSCLFSFHMHGVLTCGSLLNGVAHPTMLKSDPMAFVGSGLFDISFMYDLLTWYNFVPWTKEKMKEEMEAGTNLLVMPGGFEEASCYKRGTHRTYIKNRMGWIKYALQHGYKIYPCYTFGEELTYWNWGGLMKYRLMMNKYQLPGCIFVGKFCSWLPANDLDLVTVIGAPLELPKIEEPSSEDVAKYHGLYMDLLLALFNKHKKEHCTNPEAELTFVGPGDFGLLA